VMLISINKPVTIFSKNTIVYVALK